MKTIAIIDDHSDFRTIVKQMLYSYSNEWRLREFVSANEFFQLVGSRVPDIIILDVFLPGMDGMRALQKIKQSYPDSVVIMVSLHMNEDLVQEAQAMGADLCFQKDTFFDALKELEKLE
ncbi:MAG: response regulator [Candidatus Neomarinimicrobiota bacterium]|nr:MAG: response regulator [Candidatus Neomarinimicrobiota bacterium]